MPMIAHQRMSAIAPAPLYSAASARVAAYEDEMFEPVAPSRPSYKYSNSFMEDTVNATMQVSALVASPLAIERDDVNSGSRSQSRSPFERVNTWPSFISCADVAVLYKNEPALSREQSQRGMFECGFPGNFRPLYRITT